jgi:hypothetical protein
VTSSSILSSAMELGELFWEHDRLTLRRLTPAQSQAQLRARQKVLRHVERLMYLVDDGQLPRGDNAQFAAARGMADIMRQLVDNAQHEAPDTPAVPLPRYPGAARAVTPRIALPAPAHIWRDPEPRAEAKPTVSAPLATVTATTAAALDPHTPMICQFCGFLLERTPLAQALGRPATQGWYHVDGRKTHFPKPVIKR